MKPYDGTENYIFISYSHKDSARVLPLLEGMAKAGFRIWYDEGIEVGAEWPLFVEKRLLECKKMIYFVTEASVESKNCRNEVNLAHKKDKEILTAYLEPTELKYGMALQIGSSQSAFRDRFANDNAFLQALIDAKMLADCRCDPESAPALQNKPASTAEYPTAKDPTSANNPVYTERGFPGLTHAAIPYGVTKIESGAFKDCSSLTSISIPDSVTEIDEWAFDGCNSLTSINVNKSNAYYESIDGNLYSKDGTSLIRYAIGKPAISFIIPNSVTSIGKWAFYGCCSLTSITIPPSVHFISNQAFTGCSTLTDINVHSGNAYHKSIDGNLYSKDGTSLIRYAMGKSTIAIKIPDSVTSIGYGAFAGCKRLKHIAFPDSITKIAPAAFCRCINLTSINIPNSTVSIGSEAFEGCRNLTSISIPDSVTEIGEWAFTLCSNLKEITFRGTKQQWKNIKKGKGWAHYTGEYIIRCTDGDIPKRRFLFF